MAVQPKYRVMGVRAWTDIADAARTRVLGFLAAVNGIEAPSPVVEINLTELVREERKQKQRRAR